MVASEKGDERLARVREGFAALARGELDVIERVFAEDVRWRGLPPGPGDCLSRREVRQMLAARVAEGALGRAEVFAVDADRVAVVTSRDGVELVHVLTFAGDRVVAVQACPDRAGIAALPPAETPAAGDGSRAGESCRPDGLIPFVHVADIERSIAFYETLGFEVTDTHRHEGRLDWAALRAGGAALMLAQGAPLDAAAQGVLFYLYSRDLAGLREALVRGGVAATAIGDGSPGPREEMRVVDPDGYRLMIAQIEP